MGVRDPHSYSAWDGMAGSGCGPCVKCGTRMSKRGYSTDNGATWSTTRPPCTGHALRPVISEET